MLKKNKEKIIITIGVVITFIFYLTMLLSKETSNLDELWNYNIARNIAKGLIPYKDISLITTPFLPILEAIILRITTNELIVFRMLNALLITSILFITYKIFNNLEIKKITSAVFTSLIIFLLKDEIFLDYNFFIVLISLITTLIELKTLNKESDIKIEITLGVLGGLALCTKQTIGLVICAVIVAIPLIRKAKRGIIHSVYRLIGISIPIIMLAIYLLVTGAFEEFLSYTILAINTFSNSIPYTNLINNNDRIITCLAIVLPIITIMTAMVLMFSKIKIHYMKKKNTNLGKNDKNTEIYNFFYKTELLLIYSIPLLLIQYPIADALHFKLSNYVIIIMTFYIMHTLIKKLLKNIRKDIRNATVITIKSFAIICTLYIITNKIIIDTNTYLSVNKNNELKYLNHLIVPDYTVKLYKIIEQKEKEYEEQGKNVNILDSNAVAIHIPMDKYVKNYDMFNKGNFGKDGENGIINQIKNSKNEVYLIRKEGYNKNWQNPNMITEYIENNLNKVDEIEIYDIYE